MSMAAYFKVAESTISRWISGQLKPSKSRWDKLLEQLGEANEHEQREVDRQYYENLTMEESAWVRALLKWYREGGRSSGRPMPEMTSPTPDPPTFPPRPACEGAAPMVTDAGGTREQG